MGVLLLELPWLLVPALEGVEFVLVLECVGEKSTPASVKVARVPASGRGWRERGVRGALPRVRSCNWRAFVRARVDVDDATLKPTRT